MFFLVNFNYNHMYTTNNIFLLVILLITFFTPVTNAGENEKYHLTINVTPSDAKIRVMNIKPKYQHGIMLKSGKYDIKVTRSGYESKRWRVEIEGVDLTVNIVLNKLGTRKNINSNKGDIGNFALWEYALQLRKSKPNLFEEAQGVLLLKIEAGSQAEKIGLRRGDIIIAYAGKKINSISQLNNLIHTNADKKRIKLRFIRANAVKTVKLNGGKFGIKLATSIGEDFSLVEWFETEFLMILQQTQNGEKINQLFIDNPHLVELYQILLTRTVKKGTKEQAEWAGNMIKIIENIFKNLYLPPPYLTIVQLFEEGLKASQSGNNTIALEKFQLGLKKAQKLGHQYYIGLFLEKFGLFYYKLEQYQKSLEYFEQASVVSRNIDDANAFGNALYFIGGIYKNWGQYPKALGYYQRASVIKHHVGDKFMESSCLTGLGIIYRNLSNYEKALEYLQQALVIDRELENKRSESFDLSDIGTVYYALSQYQKALDYYQQSLKIMRDIKNQHGEGTSLHDIGMVYVNLGQYLKALDYLEKSLKVRRIIKDKHGEATSLIDISATYEKLAQYEKALDYSFQALNINRKIEYKLGEGTALNGIGTIYQRLGQYQKSLDYLQKSLKIGTDINDKSSIGQTLSNIGNVYLSWKQYQAALGYYQQSLDIFREIKSKHDETMVLGNIGVIYLKLEKTEKALDYLQQALALDKELGDRAGIGEDLMNIGIAYSTFGQYTIALDYFQQSLKITREVGNKRVEVLCLNYIAGIYQNLGQPQKYSSYYQQALAIYQEIGSPHEMEKDLTNIPSYNSNSVDQKTENDENTNNIIKMSPNEENSQIKNTRGILASIFWLIIIMVIVSIIFINNKR